MDAVADRVALGAEFVGTVPEGDKIAFAPKELPRDGVDIADVPVCWRLPSGRVECWSLERLTAATADELAGLRIRLEDDLYAPVLEAAPWQRGGGGMARGGGA